jgi:hypothetical protein
MAFWGFLLLAVGIIIIWFGTKFGKKNFYWNSM